MELREYQKRAVAALLGFVGKGVRRILACAPTGSGKGSVIAFLVASCFRKGKRALAVAHRREILIDLYNRIAALIGAENVGLVLAGDKRANPGAPIQIASIDTLRNRAWPDADLVIIDEAHRSYAASYVKLFAAYSHAVIVGFTATPTRLDGKGLGDLYDELVVFATPSELVAEGWIVPAHAFGPAKIPDVSRVRTVNGDYHQGDLAAVMSEKRLVGDLVDHWKRRANGRMTVVFAVSVAHSRAICTEFVEAGVAAEHVDGSMPNEQRDAIVSRFRAREFPVLVQCMLFVEGVDIPEIKCIVLARPTKSVTIFLQSCGRAMRPSGDIPMLLLDHAGNTSRFGCPHWDRDWSLEGESKRAGNKPAPVKTCPRCYAILALSAMTCPECGHVFERVGLKHEAGELVEISPEQPARKPAAGDPKYRYWLQQCAAAHEAGHHPWWAIHKYKEKFGEDVPENFERPPRPQYSAEAKAIGWEYFRRAGAHNGQGRAWAEKKYRNKYGGQPPADVLLGAGEAANDGEEESDNEWKTHDL